MKKSSIAAAVLIFCAAGSIFARAPIAPEFTLKYRYQNANTLASEQGEQSVWLDKTVSEVSDPQIEKAILVAKLGDLVKTTLTNFLVQCESSTDPMAPITAFMRTANIVRPTPWPTFPPADCGEVKIALANELLERVAEFSSQASGLAVVARDEKVAETLDLLRKLATNMKNFEGYFGGIELGGGISRSFLGSGGLGIATGGAQDFGFFKSIVNNGGVPRPETFDAKGFLSEFDLSMNGTPCDQLLCINPVYKYDSESKKLFVAVSMNTNVTEATFVQKPLNLSLVIDISGSMQATDETEKSRLEWAKEAAIKTIAELKNDDYLSVVVFDTTSEVLVPVTKLTSESDKEHIIDVISHLETKGSTNLYDGLKAGYELVSETAVQHADYNHRVILISDAGLNTGVTDEATNVALVSNYAAENIGLTAIGLGLNFNQDFVLGISQSLGGNYLYAHSGRDMVRYFSSFKFLVSPIAHRLKAQLSFANTNATLLNAYGIPGEALTKNDDLINVQSLFLTNQGGGTILLEYLLD